MSDVEAAELLLARTRRLRFEARILAKEMAAALYGGTAATSSQRPTTRNPPNRIHADQMLQECGVTL